MKNSLQSSFWLHTLQTCFLGASGWVCITVSSALATKSLCWHSGWKETTRRNYRPRDFKSYKYTPTQTKLSIPNTTSLQLDLRKATDFQKTGGYKWQRERRSGTRHWSQQITVKKSPFFQYRCACEHIRRGCPGEGSWRCHFISFRENASLCLDS